MIHLKGKINSATDNIPFYPIIHSSENECFTVLRRKHSDGKYYLQLFKRKGIKINLLQQIITDVYGAFLFGVLQPGLKDNEGFDLYPLDENQEDEMQRRHRPYNHLSK